MVVNAGFSEVKPQESRSSLPSATPHSCKICETFFYLDLHRGKNWEIIRDHQSHTGGGDGYWFDLWFEKAVELADQGCDLMIWLVSLARPDTTPDCYLRAYFIHDSEEQFALDFVHEVSDYTDAKDFNRKLVLCADPDDMAATKIKSKPPNLDPSSGETMARARKWLDTCINTHNMCPKPWSDQAGRIPPGSEAVKPRRLIKIRPKNSSKPLEETLRLSLVETSNMIHPQYAALSYCWGGDQAIKLSRSNLSSWTTSFSYTRLPQTIKDAIRVTVGIGLEYLWIDALCIIQDDEPDQNIELAKMADIYSQAHITLLASRSAKVEDGFLQSRRISCEKSFRVPYILPDGQIGSGILWNGRDLGASEPIDERAWCYQERLLSHRILEIGTHQTRYRCAANREEKHSAETDGWLADSETYEAHSVGTPISLPNNWDSLKSESEEFLYYWELIVGYYSHLDLGKPSDRLRAISGIARRFGKSSKSLYCVGLWRQHLIRLLLWEPGVKFGVKPKGSRISPYIAPSWSWASTSLAVGFDLMNSGSIICSVLDVFVQSSASGDCFSNALDARLTIRAPALAATLGWEEPQREICKGPPCTFGWGECDCKILEAQYSSSIFLRIVLESEVDLSNVACECEQPVEGRCDVLLIGITTSSGLIVKQHHERSGMYERIGIFSQGGHPCPRFSEWTQKNITIV